MFLWTLGLFCVLIVVLTLHTRYRKWGRMVSKIPGPKGWPLFGNTFQLMKLDPESAFKYIREMRRSHGNFIKLSAFYSSAVLIFNPEDVETLFSTTRFNKKQMPYNFLRPWLCEGLLVSNGEKWKQRRKLLTPAFHFNILRDFCTTFCEQTEQLVASIQLEVGRESTNVMPLIIKSTLNIMCETSMGMSLNKESEATINKYLKALLALGHIVEQRITRVWFYSDLLFRLSPTARREKTLLKDLHKFTNRVIDERKTKRAEETKRSDSEKYGKKRLAMLDLMLQNKEEGKIDMKGIREEVDTFMFEGHDTTATALCFMMMRIANEPQVQNLIYEELVRVLGESPRPPSMEDLNELKYLECCIKESLRLYPSVHFIARYLEEEAVLSGYRVPSGTVAVVNIFDIHHRPDLFPDPEAFIPDRFLPHNMLQRHPYSYIPFSAGPRNCIGRKFAMLEMKTMMSGLLQRFRLQPVTRPEELVFMSDLVLRPKHPIYVRFINRS